MGGAHHACGASADYRGVKFHAVGVPYHNRAVKRSIRRYRFGNHGRGNCLWKTQQRL